MQGAEFVNDLCSNYLVIPYEGGEADFALRMLKENRTEGFLPMELRRMDGRAFLYYNISGMQNMEILYAERPVGQKEFRTFMWHLHEAIELSRELFLPGNGICLEPSAIFWDLGTQKWEFVYIPGKDGREESDIQREREQLAEFLVMRADYEDRKLTETIYRFYEEICAGRMYLNSFLEREKPEEEWRAEKKPEISEQEEIIDAEILESGDGETSEQDGGEGNPETSKSRAVRGILSVLWCAAAAVTFLMGRTRREIIIPGGAAVVLLTVLILCTRRKRKSVSEAGNPEDTAENYMEENISYEIESWGTQESAAEEKTVFMDVRQEQERKLYGIGKSRQQKIFLDRLPCTVGKDKTLVNHIISDSSVSRMHVRFFEEEGSLWMQDLNSTNGTYHNGLRLRPNERVMLEPEDEVGLGRTQFVYR